MAPREFKERVSERGLDLRLSLSIGSSSSTGTVDLNLVRKDGTGTHVAKQRNSEVVKSNIADIAAGVSGTGFVLEKSVSVGTGKSSPVLSDMDSKYFIGGSSTNINSSSSTTTTSTATENTSVNNTINNTNNGIIFPKMPHMPFVSVKGSSVTGFLYLVTSTAKVFIVCACHGSFFSPAGFVQHAGCTDVTNPLRLIVVKPY